MTTNETISVRNFTFNPGNITGNQTTTAGNQTTTAGNQTGPSLPNLTANASQESNFRPYEQNEGVTDREVAVAVLRH